MLLCNDRTRFNIIIYDTIKSLKQDNWFDDFSSYMGSDDEFVLHH